MDVAKNILDSQVFITKIIIEIIINQLKLFLDQETYKNKKLIILDLDNTLWKGIVGEDRFKSGIRMDQSDHIGAVYYQVQGTIEFKR